MITDTEQRSAFDVFPDELQSFTYELDQIHIKSKNGIHLVITVLRDSILRFRYILNFSNTNDFSYALNADFTKGYNHLEVNEKPEFVEICTRKLCCKVNKSNLRVSIFDSEGNMLLEDENGFHYEESYTYGSNIVKMSKKSVPGESFYGLGDKPVDLNLRGKRFENWGTDQYAFGKNTDPLYKNVPFYMGLQQKRAYGVFFDNTFRSYFDFCNERHGVTSFWAHGGEMNYYFFYGPKAEDVIASYTELTGTPELPPLWALGYHQCKWSYYPESEVRDITAKFRALQIPCDAIYLDIDYMDGFRCFTWDEEKFPNPEKMIADLEEQGFKTIIIIDPGIKIDSNYSVFKEALENDYFCKRADGDYMKGKVWPGDCYFPDYTNPKVRAWWADLFKDLIAQKGVRGVWNDMNEPAVMEVPNKTFPDDVRHDYEGNPCSHRKVHNVYGMQMARATYEGVKKFIYPKRPFVITRSAYSGTQRYSSFWFGDNVATWEHLKIANIQAQRMSISGMSFSGSDIGGFAEQPTGELYARWIQLGIFHPFCRTHSSGDHGDQEPWTFDENITNIVRNWINLRYQLLPYTYTAFWQYTEEGLPMLNPLFVYDQDDAQTHYRNDEFIYGKQLLVCPIDEPNARGRRMYLPRGNWFNFWNNTKNEGGKEIWVDADIDKIPLFIKSGAIIPMYPVQQYVGEKKIDVLELLVYVDEVKEISEVYEDEGDGYDYKKGRYSHRVFKFNGTSEGIMITQHKSGKYITEYEHLRFRFIGLNFNINKVKIDSNKQDLTAINYDKENNTITVSKDFSQLSILP